MRKKKQYNYYRGVRTTAERRANGTRKDREAAQWRRAKRSANNIPNSYDDKRACVQKTWKVKREKQYRSEPRGAKHELYFPAANDNVVWWYVEEYLQEHDIPFVRKTIREGYTYQQEMRKWVPEPVLKGTAYTWLSKGEWVGTGEYRTYHASREVGTKLIWWSNKDIGIEYIIKQNSRP